VPASSIGFEVTETLLIEHFDFAVRVLTSIRSLGCKVGLDDFGTGYSSLGYLRRLPIDFLKIDGSLSADIDTDHQARAIVGAIITMSDALSLEVIAEGVETESQASTLRDLGCEFAQGYHYGRPATLRAQATHESAAADESGRGGVESHFGSEPGPQPRLHLK
jgi:EAL domain-containing protein (putative c-di-GMP-specific phosphodiesterase class I)